jgi:hypothetical protein
MVRSAWTGPATPRSSPAATPAAPAARPSCWSAVGSGALSSSRPPLYAPVVFCVGALTGGGTIGSARSATAPSAAPSGSMDYDRAARVCVVCCVCVWRRLCGCCEQRMQAVFCGSTSALPPRLYCHRAARAGRAAAGADVLGFAEPTRLATRVVEN